MLRLSLALAAVQLSALTLSAAEPKPIFDGKSLEGWTVTDCQAEVQDGAILLAGGNGMVRTNEKYADYVLQWQCKPLQEKAYDSGVFIRFDTPYPKGRNWPAKYQINLRQGDEGNMKDLKGAASKDLFKPGDWNAFKLTVKGTTAELELNGKPAWKADGLKEKEGYIGLQAEIPAGGKYLFRDIKITNLSEK